MGKGKGSGSGRPRKEQPKRISGTGYDIDTPSGRAAVAHLKYSRLSADGKTYEIDTDAIKDLVNAYIEANRRVKVDKDTGEETEEQQAISRVGLRIALGISRDTYSRWLQGYVAQDDIGEDSVNPNIPLSEAIRAGDDRIMQYLVETCDKYGDTKRIRLLETYGEIAPAKQQVEVTKRDNATLRKYGK